MTDIGRLRSEIETLRAENERLRNEREPLQRQVNETFCMFLDRGNELVSLRAQLAAAEDVLQIVRTYAHELNSEGSTEMFPDVCAAMHAYDQGKVMICDSAHTEGE